MEEDGGRVTFDDATTLDDAGRQSSSRWLKPLLGGLFATALITLTLAAAVILGSQEGMMVASLGQGTSTATPSPVLPSATPVPSPLPVAPSFTPPSPSPTASPTATECLAPSDWKVHAVQPGETLAQIAARYHTSESVLYRMNCLTSTTLSQGQAIYVPGISTSIPTATSLSSCQVRLDWVVYIVKRGDTLSSIARSVHISIYTLKRANCLVSDTIYAGQRLRVPYIPTPTPTQTPAPSYTPTPTGSPTSTPTGTPPTDTPSPTPTDTPTGEPPTNTPTGEPPTDTPTGEPPTDTPSPPPTDTPSPPPSDTPVPPSDTPVPPSDTPVPPPSDTPLPPGP